MNFTCDNCQRRYSIADEKVRGKTVKVRCKNCQNVISVQGPPAEMEESTRVVSLADVAKIREQELALQSAQPAARAAAAPASASPWEEEPTRAAPARPASAPWYVMVKSKQEGPLDEAGLRALVQSGAVNARSFFWQQGMGDWKRGADIAELSGLFAAPPAPPAPPPPAAVPPPAPFLSDEPATVAARGQHTRTATGANLRAQREPEPEQDQSWEDQPTTVGPAVKAPGGREPWDFDPPAQQQAPQQEAWDQPQAEQQDQAWDDQQQQQYQPEQQDQQAWDDQQQQEQYQAGQPEQDQAWDDQQQHERTDVRNNGQAGVGADLFSDLDLPAQGEQDAQGDQQMGLEAEQPDPLAGVKGKPGKDGKKPVEDTRHFMVKSGVTRRNPFWKIALFVLLPILLIAGGAFALDRLNFIPKAKVVNAQGQTVEKSYFSEEGVSELRDRLMGRKKPVAPAPAPVPTPAPAPKPPAGDATKPEGQGEPPVAPAPGTEAGKSPEELKALYGDSAKTDVGPEARKDTEEVPVDSAGTGGISEEDVAKVVAQSQGAIKGCVDQELRKNPKFKGGKVTLVATVGTSGTVKSAKLDNKNLDSAPVGTCIKKAASRMAFPAFKAEDGAEEVDVQIPLVLGAGM